MSTQHHREKDGQQRRLRKQPSVSWVDWCCGGQLLKALSCVCVCLYVCVYVSMCVCLQICICVCVSVCMFMRHLSPLCLSFHVEAPSCFATHRDTSSLR